MSFCEFQFLLITLRYVKLTTHSSISPATLRGISNVVLIHIAFVFGALHTAYSLLYLIGFISDFECMPRQPDHRRSQDQPDILRDWKKFPTVCLRVILHWLFLRRCQWEWGKAEEKPFFHVWPFLAPQKSQKAFL